MNQSRHTIRSLSRLYKQAHTCRICPRLADRNAVTGPANGPDRATFMLIGEAPGRLGADRTRQSFLGDRSGDTLRLLLKRVGIDPQDIYITNAVLCCPTDGQRNYRPTVTEICNCGGFLRRTIELVSPDVVGTLGAVALDAIRRIYDHDSRPWQLADEAGRPRPVADFILVPLYHPSPRVINTRRSFRSQLKDLRALVRAADQSTPCT